LKITKAKRGRGLIQVVECLPSKLDAFKFNPQYLKKKKKKTLYEDFVASNSVFLCPLFTVSLCYIVCAIFY
jgi:hypothetical protein